MGEETGGMKPIPIIRSGEEQFTPSANEFLAFQKQRHEQRIQWIFLGFLGVVVLAFLVPLSLWLSRIALGN